MRNALAIAAGGNWGAVFCLLGKYTQIADPNVAPCQTWTIEP